MKFIEFEGKRLSKLALGTVQFGLDYGISNTQGKPTQENVNRIIDYVCREGINCFDTAQAYGNSEEVLGRAFFNKSFDLHIISKLQSHLFVTNAEEMVSRSLKNLNITSLYGLLLHDSNLLYNWQDQYSTIVNKLMQKNKIKYFGVSIYNDDDFQCAIQNDNIKIIQIPFNIFDQRAIHLKWFEDAKHHNKLLFIRSVFLQGLILMDTEKIPEHLSGAKPYMKSLESLCATFNVSKHELALQFVDTMSPESLVLFGCDNLAQAKENITAYKNLQPLDSKISDRIISLFCNTKESIYNPSLW